jgi:hypothetical protein
VPFYLQQCRMGHKHKASIISRAEERGDKKSIEHLFAANIDYIMRQSFHVSLRDSRHWCADYKIRTGFETRDATVRKNRERKMQRVSSKMRQFP